MIKGAVFDADGTLLDSMCIWDDLGKNYLLTLGITPRDDLRDALRPLSCGQSAAYLKREYSLPFSEDEIASSITQMIASFYKNEVQLKPGAKELIEHLCANGVKLCIATASDEALISAALTRLGVRQYFSYIFTCEAVGKSKSHPDIYEAALLHLGCAKDECFVFEDSYHAVSTLKKAGFRVAGVYDEYEPRWEHMKQDCEVLFERFVPPFQI